MKGRIHTLTTALTISFVVLLLLTSTVNAPMIGLLPPAHAAAMDVTTDKTSYFVGELVTISGHAILDTLVGIQVTNPDGVIVLLVGVQANSSAIYTRTFRIPVDAVLGTYTVNADGLITTFEVVEETAPVTTTTTTTTSTTTVPTTTTSTTTVPTTTTSTTTVPTTTTITQPPVTTTSTTTTITTSTTTTTTTTTALPEQVSPLANPFLIVGMIAAIVVVGIAAFLAGRRKKIAPT